MRSRLILIIALLVILTSCQLPLGKQTAALDTSLCALSSSARVSSLTGEDAAARKTITIPSRFTDKDVTVRFNHLLCDSAAADQNVYIDNIMFLDAQGNCLGDNCPGEVCNNADDDEDGGIDEGLDPNTCQCANGGTPAAQEACNGKDDNCNEQVDDGFSAIPETCNNIDDNCDGTVDNIPADQIPLNSKQQGPCAGKKQVCSATGFVDDYSGVAGYEAKETLCDNVDNDCDGTKDNNDGVGRCKCGDTAAPISGEICNNVDDDCDGQVDEQLATCGCKDGATPTTETCNQRDDDCDGQVDGGGVCAAAVSLCAPRPQGLISWYRAEDNAQDFAAVSHGALQSGASFASGKVGNAFSFDGVDDYMKIPHSDALMPGTLTLEAWINPSEYGTKWARILEKGGYQLGGGYGLEFNPGDNHKLRFVIWQYGTSQVIDSDAPIPLNTWTHIVATFNGQVIRMYVNGELQASYQPAVLTTTAYDLVVGARTNGAPFKGLVDEVTIYNTALSAQEVKALYDAGSTGKCIERCNGQDDNGNGQIDEGLDPNKCACANGVVQAGSQTETCNGKDDDCDGSIDNFALQDFPLNTKQQGVCGQSQQMCGQSGFVDDYSGVVGYEATETLCDDLDNDCDGHKDKDDGVGRCQCGDTAAPLSAEVCNNVDDDCDGQIDEQLATCGCKNGASPQTEVCNNKDDDCDGQINEGLSCPAQQCVPQDDQLWMWWPLDTITDSQTNNVKDASYTADVYGPNAVSGKVGNAMQFDGDDDNVVISNWDFYLPGEVTLTVWISPEGDMTALPGKGSGPVIEWDWGVHVWQYPDETNLYVNLRDSGGDNHPLNAQAITRGTWNHVAVSYSRDSGDVKLYVNGNLVAEDNIGYQYLSTAQPLHFGRRAPGSFGASTGLTFNGKIDDVQFYARVLDISEVQALYNAGSSGVCP